MYNMYIIIFMDVSNTIILRTAHCVAGPFVARFLRATFTRVGEMSVEMSGEGILLH